MTNTESPTEYVNPWTVTRVDRLRILWADGLSASQCAADIGGVTRCGVIGKVHRLGLPKRQKAMPNAVRPRKGDPSLETKRRRFVARLPESNIEPEELPPPSSCDAATAFGNPVTLLELQDGACKWPVNDVSPFLFCAAETMPERPYCSRHCACAFAPSSHQRSPWYERRRAA